MCIEFANEHARERIPAQLRGAPGDFMIKDVVSSLNGGN